MIIFYPVRLIFNELNNDVLNIRDSTTFSTHFGYFVAEKSLLQKDIHKKKEVSATK